MPVKTCVFSLESPLRDSHWIPFSSTQTSLALAYGVQDEVFQAFLCLLLIGEEDKKEIFLYFWCILLIFLLSN